MGWLVFGNPSLGLPNPTTATVVTTGGAASGSTPGLPTGGIAGDEVWVAIFCGTQGAIGTVTAGWSRVGSDFAPTGCGQLAIFKKTWVNGMTGPVITTPNNYIATAFIIRSGAAYSTVQDTTGTGTGASAVIPAANPSNADSDLRLAFILSDNASQAGPNYTWPAITATGENLTGHGYKEGYFAQMAITKGCTAHHSVWNQGANGDSGTNTVAMGTGASGTTKWGVRQITLSDGTSVNGSTPTDVEELYLATEDIVAYSVEVAAQDQESASANWWGGGPRLQAGD
jgi:hypothetical protein